ncbi:hypothetical protein DYL59_09025 [Pseudomonas kairouanensis]|uniref:Uncharacterized protein n=1 Tax=Pseudomonas kairouanensis TaxID=2293832 RepID=A0A4Z0AU68_9PSED|nr:hypothetical protein [Pseudomonas kairouanensis]TFY90245.1 hypothetical protein DYL59_09025 [Pseudomonas kairouanensis]
MANPSSTQTKATVGTCSCAVAGDPNFTDYTASRFFFVPKDATGEWHIVTSNGNTGEYQILGFTLPNRGNQNDVDYSLGPGSNAFVGYQSVIPGEQRPYTTTSGNLKVTVDVQNKKLTATFDLTAVNGSRTVHLTQGSVEVEGYSDEPKTQGSGTLNALIAGDVTLDYASTDVWLSDSPVSNFPDSFLAGSQLIENRPAPQHFLLSVQLANTLAPGTYPIALDSSEARVTFIDATNRLDVFRGTSGQITIDELPQSNPLAGKLRATLTCQALNDDNVRAVSISNCSINIEK